MRLLVRGRNWLFFRGRDLCHALVAAVLRRTRRATFAVHGRRFAYFIHPYNTTWRNERTVEIPLALDVLARHRGGRILEVGNVLSHYVAAPHDVVDKYERGDGVLNEDVTDFQPAEPYDAIVAISTLEHVGLDEDERDPEKPTRALERLSSSLRPGGELFVTVPLGYNASLDRGLLGGTLEFDELAFLRRVSAQNRWEQVEASHVRGVRYGEPYEKANAIAVGVRRRRA